MKRSLFVTAICLSALIGSAPVIAKKAQLQTIDLGTTSCGAFLKEANASSNDDTGTMLVWIDGYLSGVSGDTKIQMNEFEKFVKNLVEYCEKNQDTNVLEAAKKVGIN